MSDPNNRFGAWAEKKRRSPLSTVTPPAIDRVLEPSTAQAPTLRVAVDLAPQQSSHQPSRYEPMVTRLVASTPHPQPRLHVPKLPRRVQTCVILPQAEDPWARFLDTLPDLAEAAGVDYSNGVDAMDLSGSPYMAPHGQTPPNARRRYGNGSGSLDSLLRERYGDGVDGIRNSSCSVVSTEWKTK